MKSSCKNCGAFSAFYRSGAHCFWEEYEGVCRKRNNFVNRDGNCELWVALGRPKKITVELIDNAIADVQFILNYFAADK